MIEQDLVLSLCVSAGMTRAVMVDAKGVIRAETALPLVHEEPRPGWVELDPDDIWRDILTVWRRALEMTKADDVAALTVVCQGETFVIWDRKTGRPVYPAVSSRDRRAQERAQAIVDQGFGQLIQVRTGSSPDRPSVAAKLAEILDMVEEAREKAEQGQLAFGTLDSFLIWRLTGGRVHVTEPGHAARTQLYNIHAGRWDQDLLDLFDIPAELMPTVRSSTVHYGDTDPEIYGRPIPIIGTLCDRQAAMLGTGCLDRGDTLLCLDDLGGEAAVLANTGGSAVGSRHGLSAMIAWSTPDQTTYALEGGPFDAGSGLRWLRDELRVVDDIRTFDYLARSLKSNGGVYMVPAFTGLGPPRPDRFARTAIFGLSSHSGPAELARAAMESIAYRTYDLISAMVSDGLSRPDRLVVDGSMAQTDWLLSFLAGLLDIPVSRPVHAAPGPGSKPERLGVLPDPVDEMTQVLGAAYGAAISAGSALGRFDRTEELRRRQRPPKLFYPQMTTEIRRSLLTGWQNAMDKLRHSQQK